MGSNPKSGVIDFCNKSKGVWNYSVELTGDQQSWVAKVSVSGSAGDPIYAEGYGTNKRIAETAACKDCLQSLIRRGLYSQKNAIAAVEGPGLGLKREKEGQECPPAKRQKGAFEVLTKIGISQQPLPAGVTKKPLQATAKSLITPSPAPKKASQAAKILPAAAWLPAWVRQTPPVQPRNDKGPHGAEVCGYTYDVAKPRLEKYLQQRGIQMHCESESKFNGPWRAWIQIPLPAGRGVIQRHIVGGKKNDVVRNLSLEVVGDLVQAGEFPYFQSHAQTLREGIRPCNAGIRPDLEESMRELLHQLDIPELGNELQPWVDATQWVTQVDAQEITWSLPTWGSSPWGAASQDPGMGDEDAALQRLAQELADRDSSPTYADTLERRGALPIFPMAAEILASIQSHPVVLVSGSTGCGKTTQLPQMLLESAIQEGTATRMNIICTQPRRIAAITVAERVAQERGEALGQSVGYNVRFAQVLPRGYASVCYMTTGMLLRRLGSKGLRGISHLLIDEVHERDLDTDFLLTIVRGLVHSCPGIKLVLMSATIDLDKWQSYFGADFGAMVEIPGRLYPVAIHYMEEAEQLAGFKAPPPKPGQSEEISLDLIEKLLEKLVEQSLSGDCGAILVFLPGWEIISRMQILVRKNSWLGTHTQVHVLHSHVPKDEQQAAFLPAPESMIKVILSTNIAESSVTITDVVYVVDSCRVKQLVPIQSPGGRLAYRLVNTLAAKQNLTQRSGRAGRMREGVCYRLCTRQAFEQLDFSLRPEMLRLPLHQVALNVKAMRLAQDGGGSTATFLCQAPDPPPLATVQQAVLTLQDLKAFDDNECITSLGAALAKLPYEPRMGFALLTSRLLGFEEPMAILCAFASAPPVYTNDARRGKEMAASQYVTISQHLLSDHHDLLSIFYRTREMAPNMLRNVCVREQMDIKVLLQVRDVVDQTLGILSEIFYADPVQSWSADIPRIGTASETQFDRQCWESLTFLLGLALEHIAVGNDGSRKVWLSQRKESKVSVSVGIPEVPQRSPERPFYIFSHLQENEWNSSCRGVTAAGAAATILGAARDLRYDPQNGVLLVDNWAPIRMPFHSAQLLGATRAALRVCMLDLSSSKFTISRNPEDWHQVLGSLIQELCVPFNTDISETAAMAQWTGMPKSKMSVWI